MSEGERPVRERLARVLFNRYGDAGDLFYQGEWDQAVDAILVEMREPDAAMVPVLINMIADEREVNPGVVRAKHVDDLWRAAIDAIRGEGEE